MKIRVICIAWTITSLAAACGARGVRPPESGLRIPVKVLSVTDGDTIQVLAANKTDIRAGRSGVIRPNESHSVRLLFIDAPESSNNPKLDRNLLQLHRRDIRLTKAEMTELGRRSTENLRTLIKPGQSVDLEFVSDEIRDHYGRLLAVVWADGTNANAWQVRTGFAFSYLLSEGDSEQVRYYRKIIPEFQQEARIGRLGIWKIINSP